MKIILQQDVNKLGKKGDVLEVSEGYARNFLMPKKYAIEATPHNLNAVNQHKSSVERKKKQAADEARLLAAQLGKIELTIPVKVGDNGKLFGSIGGKDISEHLAAQHNVEIDRRKIEIQGEIKGPGDYDVLLRVHPEITSKIKIHIVKG